MYDGTAHHALVTHKFTGKERDPESASGASNGLDYFGARYDNSNFGRFMSPDPLSGTPLHMINPQKWNMYAYVVNNPTKYVDPDGRDAIAVNFVSEVPLGGHEGIILVRSDGSAKYARFGPQQANSAVDKGKITEVNLKSSVQFQPNGLPTDASYKQLAGEVAGVEGVNPSTVGFNYFKTSEADSIALDNWMKEWSSHQAPDYAFNGQNCTAFCIAGLIRGGAINTQNLGRGALVPDRLFLLLSHLADENWTWQGRQERKLNPHSTSCLKRADGTCVP